MALTSPLRKKEMNRNLFRNVANTLMASALVRFSALGKREEVELMGNRNKFFG